MATKKFPVTNLDFDEVKQGLIDYLKGQEQFKDYDFEGSNMNVLMDILSYNTFQNNFYNNMVISEMFLDSAQVKDSVVSHAKELNYIPRSKTSARAVVDILLNTFGNPPSVTIPARTRILAQCGNQTYTFYNTESVVVTPSQGEYRARYLDIFEGTYVTERFDPAESDTQRYLISNPDIDLNSITVKVIENDFEEEYIYASDLYGVEADDKIFFIQPYVGDRYELFFGRDIYGAEPKTGSIIEVTYRITAGEEGNGITSFQIADDIEGFKSSVILRVASRGGANREDLNSIKYFAPKSIQVQDRAVAAKDYEILLKRNFPEIRSVAVYGGETLDPPQYGSVLISVALQDFSNISTNSLSRYRTYLKDRCALTVNPVVIPASLAYFDVVSTVTYAKNTTTKSRADIEGLARAAVLDYSDNNLGDFKKTLRLSKMAAAIDNSDENIISNQTDVRMILEIQPIPAIPENFLLDFGNKLDVRLGRSPDPSGFLLLDTAIVSSAFTVDGKSVYLKDNGEGTLDLLSPSGETFTIVQEDVGTVNYFTGQVGLDGFIVDSYVGNAIKFYAKMDSDDIKTPSKYVSFIRKEDIFVSATGITA